MIGRRRLCPAPALLLLSFLWMPVASPEQEGGLPAAGCVLWLDATHLEGAGDNPAPEWHDSSGNSRHASQPEPALQPVREGAAQAGYPALRFDGKQWLATGLILDWSGSDWTVFAVASLDVGAPENYRGIVGNRFGQGREQWWTLGAESNGTLYLELAAGHGVHTDTRLADSCLHLYSVVKSGTTFRLFQDGRLLGEAEKDNVGGADNEFRVGSWFGGDQGWIGHIAEVRVYERALLDEERGGLEQALISKWEIMPPPDIYRRQDTWAGTMVAARDALAAFASSEARGARRDWRAYIWDRIQADYPAESRVMADSASRDEVLRWFQARDGNELERELVGRVGDAIARKAEALSAEGAPAGDIRWLNLLAEAADVRARFAAARAELDRIDLRALRMAVSDLSRSYPEEYPDGEQMLAEIDRHAARRQALIADLDAFDEAALDSARAFLSLCRGALLANPLLDFDKLLFVRRGLSSPSLGLPQNWQSNCILPKTGFNDEIAVLDLSDPGGATTILYRPERPSFVGDVDLHFDGGRLLFSSVGANNRWQVFEINTDGSGLRQVTPGDQPDVDNYDACYLPDGDIIFCSNAYYAAVPCVNGLARTAVLYRMRPDGSGIRQLCFDQEHAWCPTVLNNGRVMYLRWEYTDTPHSHDRVLFHMNPDGTAQMEYYGSNSYWPNSLFYAQPVPNHPTKFVGIVGGHHGVPRMGELVLFDPARGRREASGALQRIPGHGIPVASETDPKYGSTLIEDNLVDDSWPKFLHPIPLSDKYFLVSCKPTPDALWGIYLVDVFDNMLLLREEPGYALFEPIPLRGRPVPPALPSRVDLNRDDAIVYLADVYEGGGLDGVPRGTIKALRLFTYHFVYPGMGGPQAVVGMEGPWDIKRVMGTVPVSEDGSAYFRVPANTPIAVQPLDDKGKAMQLMRSWFTAMPGEVVACAGCHESQNTAPPTRFAEALRRAPDEIEPWRGPERGFNFLREVQPVLDRYCIGCHDGDSGEARARATARWDLTMPNLKEREYITDYTSVFHHGGRDAGHFSVSYAELHRFVRRPGLESDYHMLTPMEFHANTTQLVQMLAKGHHGVRLDDEAWDRIITWIDLNAPFHGTWHEIAGEERVAHPARRRRELLKLYANMDQDFEAIPDIPQEPVETILPQPETRPPAVVSECPDWPFDAAEAMRRQVAVAQAMRLSADAPARRTIDLGDGIALDLVLIPAGSFVMGCNDGYPDEAPTAPVTIDEPFWMAVTEITNAQFEAFNPDHDSKVEHRFSMQFGVRGFYVNGPEQPAVRVSWDEATAFCEWLTAKTGQTFMLPSEAQWEYACRAGSADAFFFGPVDADYSVYANFADQTLREFVCHTYKKEREPWFDASKYDDWIPKDLRFNDGGFLSDGVGLYRPNPWGLHDMHGNVWEWTRSAYRPYPYDERDGRNAPGAQDDRVVRGGSWRDRPMRARSAMRLAYRPYQRVYNVGFRVIAPISGTVRIADAN